MESYDLHEDPYQVDGRVSGTETVAERDDLIGVASDALKNCAGATCR